MAEKLRIGVIGIGAIGQNHVKALASLPEVTLAAVYDPDPTRAAAAAAAYGTHAAASMEELATLTDAVTVAAPTAAHYETGKFLLERGKHVLIEKPLTDNAEEAWALVALAKESNLILQVGHVERFNPVISVLEERLTSPRFIEAHRLSPFPNRSMDIGVVLDLMIHDIEIILHLVKSPLIAVDAVGIPVLTKREDIANARLKFANGCVANLTASRISPERLRKIRVFQSDAYLSLDYQAQEGKIHRLTPTGIVVEEVTLEREEPLKKQLADFAKCVSQGHTPKVSGKEAAAALELAMQITRDIESAPPATNLT